MQWQSVYYTSLVFERWKRVRLMNAQYSDHGLNVFGPVFMP